MGGTSSGAGTVPAIPAEPSEHASAQPTPDRTENLLAYLRQAAAKGGIDKAKAVVRAAVKANSISAAEAEAAIASLDASVGATVVAPSISSTTVAGLAAPQACTKEKSSPAMLRYTVVGAGVPWRQAPRLDSTSLGELPDGRELTQSAQPRGGWVPVLPRGWVPLDRLILVDRGVQQMLVTAAGAGLSTIDAIVQANKDTARLANKRSLSPVVTEPSRLTRPRIAARQIKTSQLILAGDVYVLDALNILKHRNDESASRSLDWSQLSAAGRYYKQRGRQVYAFLRQTREWDPHGPNVKHLTEEFGRDFVVRCPAGACDDDFMITYARDLEAESKIGTRMACVRTENEALDESCPRVRIVTNDLFRDHSREVDRSWVSMHTVKYAFVAGRFVPESSGK